MRINCIEMLTNPIESGNEDYKIALNEADDNLGRAGFLYEDKIHPDSKLENAKDSDPTDLVYCSLDSENKILLNPKIMVGTDEKYEINVDSFPFNEVNAQFSLYRDYSHTNTYRIVFPIQMATGYIKELKILFGQPGGSTFVDAVVGIYGNDKPTVKGSRLLFNGIYLPWDGNTGTVYWSEGSRPIIEGYSDVDDERKPNIFFYCLMAGIGSSDGGYRLAGMKNSNLSILKSNNSDVKVIGSVPSFNGTFDSTFNYDVDDSDLDNLIIPYINFTMEV